VTQVLRRGYLTNGRDVNPSSGCGYCQFKNGTEYLATLNIKPEEKWRDLGIFVMFVISNWALVYFFIYTVRVRGWSFGLGWVFGEVGGWGDGAVEEGAATEERGGRKRRGDGGSW